jgi:hypothetical protein
LKDIESDHGIAGEVVALVHAPKQRLLLFPGYSGRLDPVIQMDFQARMAGHLVPLAAFLVEPEPPTLAVLEIVSDAHGYGRAVSRKAKTMVPISARSLKPMMNSTLKIRVFFFGRSCVQSLKTLKRPWCHLFSTFR